MNNTAMRIALGIEYDGTGYHGFQTQLGEVSTIQEELERALSAVADEHISVVCAGRTDSGVHAVEQIGHFDTQAIRKERSWALGVNSNLPKTIRIKWVKNVTEDFHARFSAVKRHYRYLIHNKPDLSALLYNRVTSYHAHLNEVLMLSAIQYLLGEHDFSSFRSSACQAKSPIKTVYKAEISRKADILVIDIVANSFLQHMVRNIMGVLFAIGQEKRPPGYMKELLAARNRQAGEVTASASGLYLMQIEYDSKFKLPQKVVSPLLFV